MKISFAIGCVAAFHPVRQEIVDDIKLKTTSWKPREVHENHLRHVPQDQLGSLMGSLGNDPLQH